MSVKPWREVPWPNLQWVLLDTAPGWLLRYKYGVYTLWTPDDFWIELTPEQAQQMVWGPAH